MLYSNAVRRIPLILLLCLALPFLSGCMMPDKERQAAENELKLEQEGIARLEPGAMAPAFFAEGSDGQSYDSRSALGQGPLILLFIPSIDSPNSISNVAELAEVKARLEKKGVMATAWALSSAEASEIGAIAAREKLTAPLLVDPGNSIASQYGAALPGARFAQRTLVAIGEDGSVVFYKRGFYPQELEKLLAGGVNGNAGDTEAGKSDAADTAAGNADSGTAAAGDTAAGNTGTTR